jgi:hypothetical protein
MVQEHTVLLMVVEELVLEHKICTTKQLASQIA